MSDCICGNHITKDQGVQRRGLCGDCATSLSTSQHRYVGQFEALLHTGDGIDICLDILGRIGLKLQGRQEQHARRYRIVRSVDFDQPDT